MKEITVTLSFHGDILDPRIISDRLSASPTKVSLKGERRIWSNGRETYERTNQWQLRLEPAAADNDLEDQISQLFEQLEADRAAWRDLSARFNGKLFVGSFLNNSNEEMVIGAEALRAVAERGLAIHFDIYGPTEA